MHQAGVQKRVTDAQRCPITRAIILSFWWGCQCHTRDSWSIGERQDMRLPGHLPSFCHVVTLRPPMQFSTAYSADQLQPCCDFTCVSHDFVHSLISTSSRPVLAKGLMEVAGLLAFPAPNATQHAR